ncbi:hypothetical protein ACVILE_001706 [Streptomyces sp. M18.1]
MNAAPGRGADLNGPAAQPYAPLATTAFEGTTPNILVVVDRKDWHLRPELCPAGTGLVPRHRRPRISSHWSRARFVKPSGVTSRPGAFSSGKPVMRPDLSTA